MSTVTIKAGQIGVNLTDQLTTNGQPANISGATDAMFEVYDDHGVLLFSKPGVIDDATTGLVHYTTVLGDFPDPGEFHQFWRVVYPLGVEEFYPDEGSNTIQVEPISSLLARPEDGPCDLWISWADLPCDVDLSGMAVAEAQLQSMILSWVSHTMWILSCKKYGTCRTGPERPCRQCRHRRQHCQCGLYEYLPLGKQPIVSVDEVVIEGVVLDPSAYRVDEFHRLVRIDGELWPICQDLGAADGAAHTWSVAWTYGSPVPDSGKLMAALFACNVAKSIKGEPCDLPVGTTSVTHEGLTVNIIDTAEAAAKGRTGIVVVDQWLEAVCPGKQRLGSGIFDAGRSRTTTRVGTGITG